MRGRSTGAQCWLACTLLCSGTALAGTVTVVTSLSQEMVTAYRQAFAQQHPDIYLDIVAKNTSEVLRYVERLPPQRRPDVVWASSPDAFDVLAGKQLLQPAPGVRNPQVPEKVGAIQLNQPQGLYFGQSLAGYGIMWNTEYLRQRQLPAPLQWRDLAKPIYRGHVALSAPARSGTTQLMVECILQGEGWEAGWALLQQIAGNAAEITPDSYSVPRGIGQGRYGVGMVIDAFGLAAQYAGQPVEFAYPAKTAVLPVSIGLVAGARNPQDAQRFMAFTLSTPGQQLLLDSHINRLPVLPLGNLQTPAGYPDPYEVARRSQLRFDAHVSGQRYAVVSQLFEQLITQPLGDLQAATQAMQQAEQALQQHPSAKGKALLAKARDSAYAPVLPAAALRELLRRQPGAGPLAETALVWQQKARSNYRRARQLAAEALAAAPTPAPTPAH